MQVAITIRFMQQPSKSESASEALVEAHHTFLNQLSEWSDLYQGAASDLLADLESCPTFRACLAKKDNARYLTRLLDQWKALDRPRIKWHELDSFLKPFATSLPSVAEGHHHLDR